MIVAGHSFTIQDAKIEGVVAQAIKDWATTHPDELVQFDREMKIERSETFAANGMSAGGNLRKVGEIPVTLHALMVKRLGNKSWVYDRKITRLFWSNFPVGKLKGRQ